MELNLFALCDFYYSGVCDWSVFVVELVEFWFNFTSAVAEMKLIESAVTNKESKRFASSIV